MIRKVIVVVLVAAGMGGCATIVQGTTQTVSVISKPEDGAKCDLKNSQGTWYVTTPGSVNVHKTKTDLNVFCKKEGVGTGSAVVVSKFGGTTFGNVLVGGLVGVTVDAASGANFYYDSPIVVTLSMTEAVPASTASAPAVATSPGGTAAQPVVTSPPKAASPPTPAAATAPASVPSPASTTAPPAGNSPPVATSPASATTQPAPTSPPKTSTPVEPAAATSPPAK